MAKDKASATLCTHSGGYKCSEDQVRDIIAPKPTDTWHPISHGTLLDVVLDRVANAGLVLDSEAKPEFALARDNAQMFAVYRLAREGDKEFSLALGVRNSIDKSLPAGIACGSRLFVCDNLAFSSEIVVRKKHYPDILDILPKMMDQALMRFKQDAVSQEDTFNHLKTIHVDPMKVADVLVRMAARDTIPVRSILPIRQEFIAPRFKEFKGDTAWSFYNAATTIFRHDYREVNPLIAQNRLRQIHEDVVTAFIKGETLEPSTN